MSRGTFFFTLHAGIPALILAVSGCGKAESHAGDRVYRIDVPDMACQSCAASLQAALGTVHGVEEIRVDVAAKRLDVGVDASLLPDDGALRRAIEGAGFQAGGNAENSR